MAFARPAVISGEHPLRLTCTTAPVRAMLEHCFVSDDALAIRFLACRRVLRFSGLMQPDGPSSKSPTLELQQPKMMTLQPITHSQHHNPLPMRLTATRHSFRANFGRCGVVIQRLCAALPCRLPTGFEA
jgi:hypothetical protein